nr:tail fiber domain-containing protein [uncultured Bdellovibrio sp.]
MNRFMIKYYLLSALSLALTLQHSMAHASPSTLTYQGRIVKDDGSPLEFGSVSFIFKITDPSGACIIYQEQVNGYDMTNSNGVFDVPIGNGTVTYPTDGSLSLLEAFNNSRSFICSGNSNYAAKADDGRNLRVQFFDGVGWKTISPDNVIRTVPFSGYALSAQKLGTYAANDFLVKAGLPTCASGSYLTWDGSALTCATPAAPPSTNLSGDVSGTLSANTVDKIKGVSVNFSSLNSGEILKYNGSAWVNGSLSSSSLSDGSSLLKASQMPANCSANQTLTFSSPTGSWTCDSITVTAANFGSQSANTFLAAPNGSAGNASFRTIAAADLPAGVATQWTTSSPNIYYNGGSVGIGTNSPTVKLEVAGTVYSTTGGFKFPDGTVQTTASTSSYVTVGPFDGYSRNVFVGVGHSNGTATGTSNEAYGDSSLNSLTTGYRNIAIGINTLDNVTSGTQNIGIGEHAGDNATTGSNNVAIGHHTSFASATASNQLNIGNWIYGANGDIGIGISSPTQILEVSSSAKVPLITSTGGYGGDYVGGGFLAQGMPRANGYFAFNMAHEWFAGIPYGGDGYAINYKSTSSHSNSTSDITGIGGNSNYFYISTNGKVGIGTTSPNYNLHVIGNAGLSTGTSWTNASDVRLKDIQGDYEYGLKEVLQLHTVRYNYKKGNPLGLPSDYSKTGFIAQEVQKVIPDAVTVREDGYLELNVDPIHWAVVNAVQDLNKEITRLNTENQELRQRLDQQEKELVAIKAKLGL